jgi:Flp pilus assembly protein TadD
LRREIEVLTRGWFTKVGAAFVVTAVLASTHVAAGDGTKKEASAEMEWGYKAARRGYWQEALLRFQHANDLTPDQPEILNNIAVAQEANGLFEQALLTYQTGLSIDPKDGALQRNYARFQEFYASFIAPPEEIKETGDEGKDDAKQNN